MSIYQKVNQTKMVKKLFWINFPEGCLSLKIILHCWFFHKHYKRIGHVKIPKPHCSSRECINSNCRRFDWLVFVVFGQSVRLSRLLPPLYLHSDGSLAIQPWPSLSVLWPATPLVYSTVKYAKVGFCGSLLMFFAYKKISRPNWDANSWQDVPREDTIS